MKENNWLSELGHKYITHNPQPAKLSEGATHKSTIVHFIPSNKKDKSFNLISRNKQFIDLLKWN